MANENINKDEFLRLIGESRLKMPFPDFNEKVMQRIEAAGQSQKRFPRNRILSIIFFSTAAIMGLAVIGLLPDTRFRLADLSTETTALLLNTVFIVVLLSQLEKYVRCMLARH